MDFFGPHLDPSVKGGKGTLAFLPPSMSLGDAQAQHPLSSQSERGSSGFCKEEKSPFYR